MSIARDIGHVGTRDRDEPLPDPEMIEELQWEASEEDPVRRTGTLSIALSPFYEHSLTSNRKLSFVRPRRVSVYR